MSDDELIMDMVAQILGEEDIVVGCRRALAVCRSIIAAKERERCAMIAEDAGATMDEHICVLCGEIAAAIRETGDE